MSDLHPHTPFENETVKQRKLKHKHIVVYINDKGQYGNLEVFTNYKVPTSESFAALRELLVENGETNPIILNLIRLKR